MFKKLKSLWRKAKSYFRKLNAPLLYWSILYAVICVFCILLYILMTIADWLITGKGNEPELRLFITMLLSAGAVGGIVGIGKMFVDKDNNKIPDVFEKDDGKPPFFFVKGEKSDERRISKSDSEGNN